MRPLKTLTLQLGPGRPREVGDTDWSATLVSWCEGHDYVSGFRILSFLLCVVTGLAIPQGTVITT